MAKRWRIKTVEPQKSIVANARTIISARLQHLYSCDEWAQSLQNINELHQMRICAKRLRYSMELFEFCFNRRLKKHIKLVKRIQQLLGIIHDCEVMIAFLRNWLPPSTNSKAISERVPPARAKQSAQERKGWQLEQAILELLDNRSATKAAAYSEFLALWNRMKKGGFKESLLKDLAEALRDESGRGKAS